MASSAKSSGMRRMRRNILFHPRNTPHAHPVLDDVYASLMRSPDDRQAVHKTLEQLFASLRDDQHALDAGRWQAMIECCRQHPLRGLLHEDPFTSRAFNKPRGYAGDAVLMDYLYGREEHWPAPESTRIGRHIFEFTTSAPAAEGVRSRRGMVADFVDDFANQRNRPEVLSIAAGHLREAEISAAVRRQKLGRFVALDADETSLREIRHCYGQYGVETVHSRFRDLITNRLSIGTFDCVYATGLFDYLAQTTGQRLVQTMFDLLNPGGVLIIANFLRGIRDSGYMEAFMDWDLVYRTRTDMIALTDQIAEPQVRNVRVFSEDCQNIIFMELTKK